MVPMSEVSVHSCMLILLEIIDRSLRISRITQRVQDKAIQPYSGLTIAYVVGPLPDVVINH
jgi:hypothetical protein